MRSNYGGASWLKCLIVITATAVLAACSKPTPTIEATTQPPSPTPIPSATPAPLATFSTTPIATLTPTPGPVVAYAAPDFLDSPAAREGFLLSSSDDPDCPLPCWRGLRVGESDRADVQHMFVESFNFDSGYDVFDHLEVDESAYPPPRLDFRGMIPGGYSWRIKRPAQLSGIFEVFAIIHEQTNILQGIRFEYQTGLELGHDGFNVAGSDLYQPASAGQIIRTLGDPDAIYVDWLAGIEIMLVYNSGIVVDTFVFSPRQEMTVKGVTGRYQEFCLDAPINAQKEFLVAPFDLNDPESLSEIHNRWITRWIEATQKLPLEEQGWVVTRDEIVDAALSDDGSCVYLGPTVCGEGTRCPFAP